MDTLAYVLQKYDLDATGKRIIEIPGVGRDDFALLLAELDFNRGAEIGVNQGKYSATLCAANPDLKLYSIDPWQTYPDDIVYTDQEYLDQSYEITKQKLAKYPNSTIIRAKSMEAVGDFPDQFLDFVYLDGNHDLPFVIQDIHEWNKKVRKGGIISGHDYSPGYGNSRCLVYYAVNCYVTAYGIYPLFLLGRKNETEGLTRDRPRSFFWVKND